MTALSWFVLVIGAALTVLLFAFGVRRLIGVRRSGHMAVPPCARRVYGTSALSRNANISLVGLCGQDRLGLHLHQPCRLEESRHDYQRRRGPDRPEYLTMRACDLSPVIGARQEHPRSYNVPESGSRLCERLADEVKAHPRLLVGPKRRRGSICWHRRGPRDDNTVADTDRAGVAKRLLVWRVPANQLTFHAAIIPPAG